MKLRTFILMGISLLLGTRVEAEVGLPLVRPGGISSGAAYAAALRGEQSNVKLNCSPRDHAAAYQLFLSDADTMNLPVLMENLEIRPLPRGARVRTVGLNAKTCKPFIFERQVREGELGLYSTNIQDFLGSASCGNPLEIAQEPAPIQVAQNTGWQDLAMKGPDWMPLDPIEFNEAYRYCPDRQCAAAMLTDILKEGARGAAEGFSYGWVARGGNKLVNTITNNNSATGGSNHNSNTSSSRSSSSSSSSSSTNVDVDVERPDGGSVNPGPDPPRGPINPGPDPFGGGNNQGGPADPNN